MARTIPVGLLEALAGPVTHWALLWRVRRLDGVTLGFTSTDKDLIIGGQVFRAAPSLMPSALTTGSDWSPDSMSAGGALSSSAISDADLEAGRYDGAQVVVTLVDWTDVDAGEIALMSGVLGPVERNGVAFNAQLHSVVQALDRSVTEVYSPECRAELGDKRCRVDLARYTQVQVLSAFVGARGLETAGLNAASDYYAYGRVRWLTGPNAGESGDVVASDASAVTLALAPRFVPGVGDLFELRAGCDKRSVTCKGKFANLANYRGEPAVPGVDALIRYPGL